MKRILITGANSYVGTSVGEYLSKWPNQYDVHTVDMLNGSWRNKDFSAFDVVFHVAGIAHQDFGRITEERKQLYYRVNTDLTIETAEKAKQNGVRQFIFMSSIIVYGASAKMGERKIITRETEPAPVGAYGDSKLKAERGLLPLSADGFRVCILRPPMIYGPGCKGNYPLLSKVARTLPFFPDVTNQRSMLFVDNLCAYVRGVIDGQKTGIVLPQNIEYVCTADMVRRIAEVHGKRLRLTRFFNSLLQIMSGTVGAIDRVFGSMVYEQMDEQPKGMVDLPESIVLTESGLAQ